MQVFRNQSALPPALRGAALALGNFDGVHRGHAALIRRARALAPVLGVLTFSPHPRLVTQPGRPSFLLSSPEARLALLADLGVDFCVEVPFTAETAATPAEKFVTDTLVGRTGARHLVFGHDFRFGSRRGGDADLLHAMGRDHGFTAHAVEPVLDEGGIRYSSSAIREHIRAGDIAAATQCLGHRWRLDISSYALTAHDGDTLAFRFGTYLKPAPGDYVVQLSGSHRQDGVLRVSGDCDLGRLHLQDVDRIHGQPLQMELVAALRRPMEAQVHRLVVPQRAPHLHLAQA